MKTYLFLAILLLCTVTAFSQSCPSTATALGHELPVVQLGNQCFVLVNSREYLNTALATQTGVVTTTQAGPFRLTVQLNGGNITRYDYEFSREDCEVMETVLLDAQLFYHVSVEGLSSANLTITGIIESDRKYHIQVHQINDELGTHINKSGIDFIQEEFNVLGGGVLGPIIESAVSLIGTRTLRALIQDLNGMGNTIIKLGNQTIDIPAELTGPAIVCNTPITLSVPPNFDSYLWSDNSTGNTLEVHNPGAYSVTLTDGFCNKKTLSTNVTAGTTPKDFINSEILCTGKVKLSADGFPSVRWNSGAEANFIEIGTTGTYSAEVTTQDGCTGTDQVNLMFDACQPTATVAALSISAVCSDFPLITRRWKLTNPNSTVVRLDWIIEGTIQKSWLDVPPGDSYLSTLNVINKNHKLNVNWHDGSGKLQSASAITIATKCTNTPTSTSTSSRSTNVYPNPGGDQITLEISNGGEELTTLQIFTLSGTPKRIQQIQLSPGTNFIMQNISDLERGVYIMKVNGESIRFTKE